MERVVACLIDEKNIQVRRSLCFFFSFFSSHSLLCLLSKIILLFQVKINSLRVCKHLIANEKGGGFWVVHREVC